MELSAKKFNLNSPVHFGGLIVFAARCGFEAMPRNKVFLRALATKDISRFYSLSTGDGSHDCFSLLK
jgi:hypothetical protein